MVVEKTLAVWGRAWIATGQSWIKKGLHQQTSVKSLRMLFWADAGMTVSGFVCRNFLGHVGEAAGMFAALSWTGAQTGGLFLLASSVWQLHDRPAAARFLCLCGYQNVFVSACMWLWAAVAFMYVICACSNQAPLVSFHWLADGCFVRFWHRKDRAIWSWCPRNTQWWLARIPVTSASTTTSCSTAPSMGCWAPTRTSSLSL